MFRAIHSETISHSWRHVPHHLHHNCYCYHHPHQNIQYHLFLTPFVKKTQPRQWHSLFVLYCYTSDLTNGIRYKTQEQIWSSVMGWACLSNPTLQCRWCFLERESEIFPPCLCATRIHLSVESAKAKRRSILNRSLDKKSHPQKVKVRPSTGVSALQLQNLDKVQRDSDERVTRF